MLGLAMTHPWSSKGHQDVLVLVQSNVLEVVNAECSVGRRRRGLDL